MVPTETFVLSPVLDKDDLARCIDWIHDLKTREVRHARIDIRLHHERLDLAFLWHRHFTIACPAYLIGLPFIETRMHGSNGMSAMLVWLSGVNRSIVKGTTVTRPHFLEFGTPLYDRLQETLARPVLFTDAEAKRWGGSREYRMACAALLLANPLSTTKDLISIYRGTLVDDETTDDRH